ncbi:MAG: hypothetical protein BECKG1743F_GA0114225_112742, partial [Candidatus Kentron sp. G]
CSTCMWDATPEITRAVTHGEIKDIHKEIKNLYQAINSQTWKMIGAMGLAMGLFVSLSKLLERL